MKDDIYSFTLVFTIESALAYSKVFFDLFMELDFATVLLAHPVTIEGSITTAKFVLSFLAVVCFQVVPDGRYHVGVLLSSSNGGEQVGAGLDM